MAKRLVATGRRIGDQPFLLQTTLESRVQVLTFQLEGGAWETLARRKSPNARLDTSPWHLLESRRAKTEEAARADFAALVGEFGP